MAVARFSAAPWAGCRQAWRALLGLIFPACCVACQNRFVRGDLEFVVCHTTKERAAPPAPGGILEPLLCPDCLQTIRPMEAPHCEICGRMFASRQTRSHTCGACHNSPPVFHRARSVLTYAGPVREIVHAYKYHLRPELSRELGSLLAWGAGRWYARADHDLIIPVPLHTGRLRKRGFNQAALMARHWLKLRADRVPGTPLPVLEATNLVRVRATQPQNQLSPAQRRENIRGAFAIRNPALLHGRTVLLVDDVFTTGATVTECARVLIKAGARRVEVLTLART